MSVAGDLWVREAGATGGWSRVTEGVEWDHSPAWLADGSGLVYARDRPGRRDLFRVLVGAIGPTRAPQPVGAGTGWESEPSVAPDGSVVFVRGRGTEARLWVRSPDGAEQRLTGEETHAERWPAVAPDGSRVAYVRVREGPDELRVQWLDRDSSATVVADRDLESPAWSPAGDRLAFTTRTGQAGVWVTPVDGRYVNLVSARRARAAWTPDGERFALALVPPADAAYNGDPDRGADRERAPSFLLEDALWMVAAPAAPDAGAAPLPATGLSVDRRAANLAVFDDVWNRVAQTSFAGDRARAGNEWERVRERHRPAAAAADSPFALESVIHAMLRERPPLREPASGWAAVSSAHPVATEAGLEILRQGGNVVDAAVAVSFALGVVEPDASGIGGYGQMLIAAPGKAEPVLIEFMSRAPEEAGLSNRALLQDGRYPNDGPVLAMVPGTVAGMELAWKRYGSGKVAWAALLAPAILAAEQGYTVSEGLATTLAREQSHLRKYSGSRALFFRDGKPLEAGDTVRNPDLAWSLREIADRGAGAFYDGEVARRLVADLRGQGSAMRLSDLARYHAVERRPVGGRYRGYDVFSSAPPAAGGATLIAQLNLLEHHTPRGPYPEDAATAHAMLEAWKLVPSSRGRIADPGLWPVRLEAHVSKDSARVRWSCYRPDRALTLTEVRGDVPACTGDALRATSRDEALPAALEADDCTDDRECHQSGTTAFIVADASGNAVSVTQTLGTWGGNFYVSPGLGFLYNDKLTSYGLDPDQFGARLPNARHGSSLAPTIVMQGQGASRRPVLAVGAAGNAWITSAVYGIVTGVLDHGLSAQQAIETPRFMIGGRGPGGGPEPGEFVVLLEDGFAPAVTRRLRGLGHALQPISLKGELRMGYAAAITIGDRSVTAGADPRRSGAAGAVQCGEAGPACGRR